MRKKDKGYKRIEISDIDYEYKNKLSLFSIENIYNKISLICLIILGILILIFVFLSIYYIIISNRDNNKYKFEKKRQNNLKVKKDLTFKNYKKNKTKKNKIYKNKKNNTNSSNRLNKTNRLNKRNKIKNKNYLKDDNITYDIYTKTFEEVNNPKISIITIVDNQEKLERLFYSIQLQNFSDIEIIVIDDNITNKTSSIYNKIKINDKRVKIIKLNNKEGKLNKRIKSINKSKGEYIIFIDSDDYFSNNYLFKYIYNKAKNESIDIIEFNSLHYIDPYMRKKFYYPKLFDEMFFTRDMINMKQFHLNGKLIKKELLLNSIKNIDNYYLEKNIEYFEERMILLILLKKAKSFLILIINSTNKICYKNELNIMLPNEKNKIDFILYLKFLMQYTDNNVPEKRLSSYLLINSFMSNKFTFKDENNKKIFNETINLFLNCEKISDYDLFKIKTHLNFT